MLTDARAMQTAVALAVGRGDAFLVHGVLRQLDPVETVQVVMELGGFVASLLRDRGDEPDEALRKVGLRLAQTEEPV